MNDSSHVDNDVLNLFDSSYVFHFETVNSKCWKTKGIFFSLD